MKTNGFILILALLGHLSLALSASFDFFFFVQRWPGSFYCNPPLHNCTDNYKAPVNFGIHGLWPMYNNGKYPKDCPGKPLEIKNIANLVPKLKKEWPALICRCWKNLEEFWSHEWSKHGTCTQLSQNRYFNLNIQLKTKTDILRTLESKRIRPDGKLHSLRSIKKALRSKVGFEPRIVCNQDPKNKSVSQLFEVYFCVDKKGQNFINCPRNGVTDKDRDCKTNVKFPIYKRHN